MTHSIAYISFDFETTTVRGNLNPMDPAVRPVAMGVLIHYDTNDDELHRYAFPPVWGHHVKKHERREARETLQLFFTSIDSLANDSLMFVGHNIGYDLIMLKKLCAALGMLQWYDETFLKRDDVFVWDTQLAEYMLTGQEHKYASLGDLITNYGLLGHDKDFLEPYITHGISIATLYPYDRIQRLHYPTLFVTKLPNFFPGDSYLLGDIDATLDVMLLQFDKAADVSPKLLQLILYQCKFRLWTVEMEFFGIQIDLERLSLLEGTIKGDKFTVHSTYSKLLKKLLSQYTGLAVIDRLFNKYEPTGSKILSALLYGGELEYKQPMPVKDEDGKPLYTKAGKLKTKLMPFTLVLPGVVDIKILNKALYYDEDRECKLDDMYLNTILNLSASAMKGRHMQTEYVDMLTNLILYRGYQKELSTYIEPYLNPTSKGLSIYDGRLHPRLQHTATSTGRLASSSPNALNLPRDDDE